MVRILLFLLLLAPGPAFPQSTVDNAAELKDRRSDLWYADSSFYLPPESAPQQAATGAAPSKRTDTRLLKTIATPLGYLIGILIAGTLVYAFYDFTRKNKKPETGNRPSGDIEMAENLHRADFGNLIKSAETSGDFRLALRYHYLQLLQVFSRQRLIRYEKNKTNRQYADEIKNHKWGPAFRKATRYYNFVWYGEHPLPEENYYLLAEHFRKMPPYE